MRYLLIVFALFITGSAYCAPDTSLVKYPNSFAHGDSTTLDSNIGPQYIGGQLQLPSYANGDVTQFLTVDAFGNVYLATASGSGLTIGNPVIGGNVNDVLFIGGGGNLDQDDNLNYIPGTGLTIQYDGAAFINYSSDGTALNVLYTAGDIPYIIQGSTSGSWQASVDANTTGVNFNNYISTSSQYIGYDASTVEVAIFGAEQAGNNLLALSSQTGNTTTTLYVPDDDGGGLGSDLFYGENYTPDLNMTNAAGGFDLTIDNGGNARINTGLTLGIGGELGSTYTLPNTDGSNGYALATDGSGNVTWQNVSGSIAIGSTVNGGDANDVLFLDGSGNLAQDDNFLYIPGTGLSVQSDGSDIINRSTDQTALSEFYNSDDVPYILQSSSYGTYTQTVDANTGGAAFNNYVTSTDGFFIPNGGNATAFVVANGVGATSNSGASAITFTAPPDDSPPNISMNDNLGHSVLINLSTGGNTINFIPPLFANDPAAEAGGLTYGDWYFNTTTNSLTFLQL